MTYDDAAIERAARALCVAQHFGDTDAPVYVGMKSIPVWRSRLPQVRAVISALASADTHPKGGDEGNTSAPFMSGAVPPVEAGDAQNPPKG